MLYTIRYLVFGIQIVRPNSTICIRYSNFLDTEQYSAFGIFGFSQYGIVFNIRYLVIYENRIIFGIHIRSNKKVFVTLCQRGQRGGGMRGGGHYGQSHYKNKRNKNTNFDSTGPIRFKIGQRCGFSTQNFSSLALKGTKILTFACTH